VTLIVLEPHEHNAAVGVGVARFNARRDSEDKHYYDRSRMEDDFTAGIASAVCEMAVAKHTNRYWGAHVWHASDHDKYKDMPDVGTNIEVRRTRTDFVAIRHKDVQANRVIFAASVKLPEFVEVTIHGWITAAEGWELGYPADYDKQGLTRKLALTELHK
jgi:hypothetical protein